MYTTVRIVNKIVIVASMKISGSAKFSIDQSVCGMPNNPVMKPIKNIKSKLTIVNGKIVYADDDYKTLAPELPAIVPSWSPVKFFGGYQNF